MKDGNYKYFTETGGSFHIEQNTRTKPFFLARQRLWREGRGSSNKESPFTEHRRRASDSINESNSVVHKKSSYRLQNLKITMVSATFESCTPTRHEQEKSYRISQDHSNPAVAYLQLNHPHCVSIRSVVAFPGNLHPRYLWLLHNFIPSAHLVESFPV